jgi:hypothetical protein
MVADLDARFVLLQVAIAADLRDVNLMFPAAIDTTETRLLLCPAPILTDIETMFVDVSSIDCGRLSNNVLVVSSSDSGRLGDKVFVLSSRD